MTIRFLPQIKKELQLALSTLTRVLDNLVRVFGWKRGFARVT
jgi:hypothetical protein